MCQQEISVTLAVTAVSVGGIRVDETKFSRKVGMKTGLNQNNESEL